MQPTDSSETDDTFCAVVMQMLRLSNAFPLALPARSEITTDPLSGRMSPSDARFCTDTLCHSNRPTVPWENARRVPFPVPQSQSPVSERMG